MRKLLVASAAIAVLGAVVAPHAASAAANHHDAPAAGPQAVPANAPFHSRYVTLPGVAQPNVTGPTVKFFNATATVNGHTYKLQLVGTAPTDSAHPKSVINVKVIPVAWHFTDGVTLDPTKTLPACGGGGTPVNRFKNSVLVKNLQVNGVGRQITEEFRREEFWNWAKPGGSNPNYSVRINVTVLPKFTANVNGPSVATPCGRGGNITLSSIDSYLRSTIIPAYGGNIKTTEFPLLLFSNITQCDGSCGIGGYHSSYNRNGHTQTYGTSNFATDGRYPAGSDTVVAGHEIAEWYDDPFVNNQAPPWGHIGQVSGCYPFYEVGDPLSGTKFTIAGSHFQDEAFLPWFYRISPSFSVNGWYSLFGTFKSPAKPCS